MFTFISLTLAATLIGYFGGAIVLAIALGTAVAGVIFVKLLPAVSIFIVVTTIGLLALRYRWRQ